MDSFQYALEIVDIQATPYLANGIGILINLPLSLVSNVSDNSLEQNCQSKDMRQLQTDRGASNIMAPSNNAKCGSQFALLEVNEFR